MTLRVKLSFLISGCIIFSSLILGLISSNQVEKHLLEQTHLRLHDASLKIASKINASLNYRKKTLQKLANHSTLSLYLTDSKSIDMMQIEDLLLLASEIFGEISFIDNTGNTISMVMSGKLNLTPSNRSEQAFFQDMKLSPESYISTIETNESDNQLRFTYKVMSIYEEPAGMITGTISPDILRNIIESLEELGDDKSYLVNNDGEYVCAHDHTKQQAFDSSAFERLSSSTVTRGYSADTIISVNIKGVDSYVEYAPLGRHDWGIITSIGKTAVENKISSLTNLLFFTSLVVIFIGIILGLFFSATISSPLSKLSGLAKKISQGDYSSRIAVTSTDEIGSLATSFNTMVEEIGDLRSSLEEKVQTKTTQLLQSNKAQTSINSILNLALQDISLEELLQLFIEEIASLPELNLSDKGAIFLIEEDPDLLVLKGAYNLAEPLHDICKTVPFGRCLCGRVAEEKRVIFVNCIDHKHDNTFEGISEHGHYCVPVFTPDREICGVFTVYIPAGAEHDQQVEDFLVSASSILGGIIQNRQSEKKRLESEEKYRAITNTANDAIIMMNTTGEITYWNPAASTIFGYAEDEALGQDLHNLISPPQYHGPARDGMKKFMQSGKGDAIGKTLELTGLKKNGDEFPIELSLSVIHEKDSWSAVGLVRDITERKDSEDEKLKLQGQLRQAQKMEAIGTLAGGIAHDFNNILTSVIGYSDLLKDTLEDNPQAMEDLGQVIDAADRAKNLVRQILTFSRQSEQELLPVQISLIVKEALKLLRASIPTTIEINKRINLADASVLADPTQVHQIVMNICTNAYKAMPDGGVLEVALDDEQPDPSLLKLQPDLPEEPFVCLKISDTGYGMDEETISRIFEPYFSTRKKEDGTGLGLSVVHGIVTGMGGVISVDSKINEGTTFSIYMPQVQGKTVVKEQKTEPLSTGTEHILYVDDEFSIVSLGKRRLEEVGYKVSTRTSSIEALEAFRHHPERYDLVISDQAMPNMSGITLATEMLKIRPDTPIIICTGYESIELNDEAKQTGIKEVLIKPVSKMLFAKTIRKALDREESWQTTSPITY